MKIYICQSDAGSRTTYTEPVPAVEVDAHRFVRGDVWLSPAEVVERWTPLTFEIKGLNNKRATVRDAYTAHLPAGLGLLLSERACVAVEERFPGECTFLPVRMTNSDMRFNAVWPNRCAIEALDEASSTISQNSYGGRMIKSVRCYQFVEQRLDGANFFTLPPNYTGVGMFVTEAVEAMVKELKLSGFMFWDRSCEAIAAKLAAVSAAR